MITTSVQQLSGVSHIIRVHPEGGDHGTDWSVAVVVETDGLTAHLYGLQSRVTLAEARAIRAQLEAMGFAAATWERYRGGDERKTVRLRK